MDQILNVLVFGLLLGGIYGLVSIGLNLIFGVVRIVNFAQGELVMFGMYGSYYAYAQFGMSPYVSVLVVAPLVGVLGVAIQRLVIQPLHNESNMQSSPKNLHVDGTPNLKLAPQGSALSSS